MADKWTSGLRDLDARQTRQRLAALMAECRFAADGLEHFQRQGLREQVAATELALLRVAKAEIERLAEKLAEYRQPFEPAPPPTYYDPYAAARARAEAKAKEAAEATPEPQPEPAPVSEPAPVTPPRPVLPPRPGMRLPPMMPRRSA
ncbi:hypothetical protein [Methylobacterium nonmethylotrophicum]|uniref:Uncharacterized protein n=1 Tax=Methylobacterium nonmethylotrophicum TaxID=1141884 RepID=A0A4Z0NG44_9HYPH|nr:hypothetical protein [Methylobacterium nonmethylotrophicum]TGD95239.1 hypothetical protein EU555_28660 [Methylobacterium nonmethylotrophicum]